MGEWSGRSLKSFREISHLKTSARFECGTLALPRLGWKTMLLRDERDLHSSTGLTRPTEILLYFGMKPDVTLYRFPIHHGFAHFEVDIRSKRLHAQMRPAEFLHLTPHSRSQPESLLLSTALSRSPFAQTTESQLMAPFLPMQLYFGNWPVLPQTTLLSGSEEFLSGLPRFNLPSAYPATTTGQFLRLEVNIYSSNPVNPPPPPRTNGLLHTLDRATSAPPFIHPTFTSPTTPLRNWCGHAQSRVYNTPNTRYEVILNTSLLVSDWMPHRRSRCYNPTICYCSRVNQPTSSLDLKARTFSLPELAWIPIACQIRIICHSQTPRIVH